MRFIHTALVFLLSVASTAQLPKNLKFDELVYSADSTTILIRNGSSSSVFDIVSNKYLIESTKSIVLNFISSNAYVEIEARSLKLKIHLVVGGEHLHLSGTTNRCEIATKHESDGRNYFYYEGKYLDSAFNELPVPETPIVNWRTFGIFKCLNGNYILNNYYGSEILGGEMAEHTVEDGEKLSGVFNVEINDWTIEPGYKSCYYLNEHIFCLKENFVPSTEDEETTYLPKYSHYYDIFKINGQTCSKILSQVTSNSNLDVASFLEVDEAMCFEDSVHYVVKKDEKMGFMFFQLFESSYAPFPNFRIEQLVEPKADFVIFSNAYRKLIVVNRDSVNVISLYHLVDRSYNNYKSDELFALTVDPKLVGYFALEHSLNGPEFILNQKSFCKISENSKYYTIEDSTEMINSPMNFGVCRVNDSIFIVSNFLPPQHPNWPLQSSVYSGEDSIDASGNVVYPPLEPGFDQSGVYNVNVASWIVDPLYRSIHSGSNGYLLERIIYNENNMPERSEFSVVDTNGRVMKSGLSLLEVTQNSEYLIYFIDDQYKVDSLFEAPGGINKHLLNNERHKSYYARIGKSLGVYQPFTAQVSFSSELKCEPMEFVHENSDIGFRFWISLDSIHIETLFESKAVSRTNGKIIYHQKDGFIGDTYGIENNTESESSYELILIEKLDTIRLMRSRELNVIFTSTLASIEMDGDLLIVNDCSKSDYDYKYYPEIVPGNKIESENSSIWRFVSGAWVKVSPDYAAIDKIPGGYIANSGAISMVTEFHYQQTSTKYNSTPSAYFLLDSNMHVLMYMDYFDFAYIEDLGFGLKVQLNKEDKFFFMTYDLVAVTNAEWDRFELENGKLKAIIDTQYEIDPETGELIYNEYGVPNEVVSSTTKYFKMP